jgi:hypothetical protein
VKSDGLRLRQPQSSGSNAAVEVGLAGEAMVFVQRNDLFEISPFMISK